MAVYSRLNPYGFLETPYRVVENGKATSRTMYLSANEEDYYVVAQSDSKLGENGEFLDSLVSCRYRGDFPLKSPDEIQMMEVDPLQIVSLSTGIIPFLEHDDANRALMGSNMQRQAVPLLFTEAPIVGTGLEKVIAYDSGVCVVSQADGVVIKVDSSYIDVLENKTKEVRRYPLLKYKRTNQSTCINHVSRVKAYFAPETGKVDKITEKELIFFGESGQKYCFPMETPQGKNMAMVKEAATIVHNELLLGEIVCGETRDTNANVTTTGTILADGHSCDLGRLALGKNIVVAFMPWGGYNFEDAIVLSENLVKTDCFTSIHIGEFEIQARETKLGKEVITRDIPNIGDRAFRDLDGEGIIRLGASVQSGDILVGMVFS